MALLLVHRLSKWSIFNEIRCAYLLMACSLSKFYILFKGNADYLSWEEGNIKKKLKLLHVKILSYFTYSKFENISR